MKLKNSIIIITACPGCILPLKAKLINTFDKNIIEHGLKAKTPVYIYEIPFSEFDSFIEINKDILIVNGLYTVPKVEDVEKK